jgi:pimeloyl-ACP methyl ester carboxylesterase
VWQARVVRELRHGTADLGDVRLHYVEQGEGPLVVLLHGFPDFWFTWRHQIPALATAGFRVVAPDMRGYNRSSRPTGVAAYDSDLLARDVARLIEDRGERSAMVAGHDWGAAVAWATAINHPDAVERLAILNVPHPRRMIQGLRRPRQLLRSWYMFFFQLPWLPEQVMRVRGWAFLRYALQQDAREGAFTDADMERYVEAWEQPGAATAMLNYYRAAFRQTPRAAERRIRPIEAPTLVLWGEQDRALGKELAEPEARDVPNLQEVVRFPQASHWVQHDEAGRVSRLLVDFFGAR